MDEPKAAFHARAVLGVVDEATGGSQLPGVTEQLDERYRDLFQFADVRAG